MTALKSIGMFANCDPHKIVAIVARLVGTSRCGFALTTIPFLVPTIRFNGEYRKGLVKVHATVS